jgi:uncharacterized membrane protein YebE (DUF533 family)
MSFVRTLAGVAMGFAAAKGLDHYKKMGGLSGMQKQFEASGSTMGAQLGAMAERMGVPGGAEKVNEFIARMSAAPAAATEAGSAGLGGLLAAMKSTAETGGKMADDMIGALFGGTPVAVAQEENAKLMLRSMIQAAKADGQISEEERKTIMDQLGDAKPEERAFVEDEMNKPLDPMALAKDTQESMKAQVYATSLMAVRADSAAESAYLRGLSQALGLSDATRDRIHASMGLPPLSDAA